LDTLVTVPALLVVAILSSLFTLLSCLLLSAIIRRGLYGIGLRELFLGAAPRLSDVLPGLQSVRALFVFLGVAILTAQGVAIGAACVIPGLTMGHLPLAGGVAGVLLTLAQLACGWSDGPSKSPPPVGDGGGQVEGHVGNADSGSTAHADSSTSTFTAKDVALVVALCIGVLRVATSQIRGIEAGERRAVLLRLGGLLRETGCELEDVKSLLPIHDEQAPASVPRFLEEIVLGGLLLPEFLRAIETLNTRGQIQAKEPPLEVPTREEK